MTQKTVYIGTAGWAVPAKNRDQFSVADSTLARYASRFNAVEINSSFYRPHRIATYQRWAQCVPPGFRFAVKMPKAITHVAKLVGVHDALGEFVAQVSGLEEKLGPVLVQLPPKLEFDMQVATAFFKQLRALHDGPVVLEPRNASWFDAQANGLLIKWRVARVAADPVKISLAADPGGWPGLHYYRLHGSPRTYFSPYSPEYLTELADELRRAAIDTWCIFDNTASAAAVDNALHLTERLGSATRQPQIDSSPAGSYSGARARHRPKAIRRRVR